MVLGPVWLWHRVWRSEVKDRSPRHGGEEGTGSQPGVAPAAGPAPSRLSNLMRRKVIVTAIQKVVRGL